MATEMKQPPPYAIASVDHALRLATILQLEGSLSVADAAARLGVARSTAHRLLAMLVYRDFAVQDDTKVYRAGPVLELGSHSHSTVSLLRRAALPQLRELVDRLGESVNLTVRTGDTARFIACVECQQALRVGSREGMVFPAHQTTAGLLLLAELTDEELDSVYAGAGRGEVPAMDELRRELAKVRRNGFALNQGRSERGVVAVGVPVRSPDGAALAGVSVSMPSVRYDRRRLRAIVADLSSAVRALEADLHEQLRVQRQESAHRQ
ncbi:DNA-binding IclR family transcriptional regulator [Prauserella sediminis]|uniref:DNA-binding IclR family transcriptional regulator n=1 Tax=Prauserella sediminis TaxID=577680 RepID=A0A839XMW0_9PSEU|nr:IclR family transcriptional regulator [Prauserella sediminis]MBB3664600.1 DNA-binding IclR family transcriptional regulator [Prauserella sediminis]